MSFPFLPTNKGGGINFIWEKGEEAYYPMSDDKNSELFAKYRELADNEDKIIFGGRLGMYQYFDMWKVIEEALKLVDNME